MQKILNKLIATILTIIFVGTNFVPGLAYATSEIQQNTKTSEENVEFNASINDSYDATINVNEKEELKFNLKVAGTGYLKNATVTLNNNNYQLMEQKDVEIQDGNKIKLNDVNAEEELNVVIPIKVNKQDKVLENEMNRESSATLDATYVNEKGKEKKISKELKLKLAWTADIKEKVNQTLIRNIKLGENKTMLSFKIDEGIENNTIPYGTKKLTVQVPALNNVKPSNVIVIGDNIKYNYENDQVTIEKENKVDQDGKIAWNSQDTYIVTYIYDTDAVPASIESKVTAETIANGQNAKAELENSVYELKNQIGSLVDVEITGTNELSKGYMYTNLNRQEDKLETKYNLTYTANIGYRELVDKIIIREQNPLLGSKETNFFKTKKITIDKDNLIDILGEEGYIKVTSEDGKEIGKFYKGLSEITTEEKNIIFEASKPVKEGLLKINIEKAIIENNEYNKEELKRIEEMTTRAVVESYNGESQISLTPITKVIKLIDPTSEASIDVNVDNLSTVITNENVILTATLKTNSIDKALYQNPTMKVILPEEVKNINIKEATLIYEDELQPAKFETNNNVIDVELKGIQTKYGNQSTSEGTVVRIVADLNLDNLAPSKQEVIKLTYSNEATNETKEVTKEIGIVAPAEFITTNSIEVDGKKLTAQESEKTAKIKANSEEKEATISGTIINNLGKDTQGVTIKGNIPSNAENNMSINIKTGVNVEGANADIYYSNNIDEDINGSNWTHEATSDTKAFKAVLADNLVDKQAINFNYKVNVPENVGYEKTVKSTYAVYYNNNAQEGNTRNKVMAKAVGMETGVANPLQLKVTMIDQATRQEIADGVDVQDGTYITYKLRITNSGKEDISNIKLITDYPNEINLVTFEEMAGIKNSKIDKMTKKFTHNISEIKAGESKEFTSDLIVMSGIEDDSKKNAIITSTATADNIDEESKITNQINAIKGNLGVMDFLVENELVVGDEFNYSVDIVNTSVNEKNNIQVTIAIPKEFEFKSISERDYTYDENSQILTYKLERLSGNSNNNTIIRLKVKQVENDSTVKISANIKCDGMENAKQSPSVEYKIIASIVDVKHTSNITDGKLTDKDKLIYYIDITNKTSKDIIVNLIDRIPSSLATKSYTKIDSDGEKTIEHTGRTILEKISIKAKQTGKIAITTEPYTLEQGKSVNIENKPKITINSKNIEVQSTTHTIVGSSDYSSGDPDNWEDNNGDEELDTEKGTYVLNGVAWIDKNNDGKKEESESRISGQVVKLYDKDSGKLAVDVNGKELTTKTNNVGKYSFTNVVPGNYIVVMEYDNKMYELTTYKAKDLVESEDSDFIDATLDGKEVAATNTIAVIDTNIYNIDLGLVDRNRFDLKLEKKVKRITVTNTKDDIKNRIYDFDDKSIAKVELPNANIDTATVTVEYIIKVTNEGQIPGYAKSIVDYLPSGMTFNSEINTTWYVGNDGNAYCTSLANTIINPGETKEIRLVLTRKMSDSNLGTIRNTAEISSYYNEYGLEDIDSIAGNKKNGEDDMSSIDTIIGTATGKTTMAILGITLGILSIIATAVYVTKRYVINKIV